MKTLRLYCESVGCKKTFRNQAGLDSHIMQDHRNNNYTLENEFKCPKQVLLSKINNKIKNPNLQKRFWLKIP